MATRTATKPFVHLHVHSHFSLLDGACRTDRLVARARELKQPAIAITDHGSLFGAVDFYTKAVDAGVKPILGIEAYMAPDSRHSRVTTGVKDGGYHLLLLAENLAGYRNLLKLASIAYVEGFYYKPRIDKEVLRAHREGLIATSACLGGEIPTALLADDRRRAKQLAETYLEIFGPDRFFIELQKHIPEQDRVNPELMDLADRLGVGCVATNDVHFLLEDDHDPHAVLCCISTGKQISDESRMKYPRELFLKSAEQMYAAMDDPKWVAACANTVQIAERCNVELDFSTSHAPVVKIEKKAYEAHGSQSTGFEPIDGHAPGSTEWYKAFCDRYRLEPFDSVGDTDTTADELKRQCDAALRELCEAGLLWRYGETGVTDEIRARLERELQVLADKSISAYFLIVWDFVNEARRRGIPANARGSGVGTMVGYVLGLSNACPVKYGLLFERFTDPDRSEYPDIDIDMCQDGRAEIIEYVRQKYGHVAQIITFGTLKARAAIRDVGRVLNVPLPEVEKVCKLVGDGIGMTIDKALDREPELRQLYEQSETHRQMIDTARRLEGLARHAGVHAAGVVVATQPLDNIIPLYKPAGADQLVTQWDGPTVEKVGLLKMDFLGLRTLSIIERARQLIRQSLDDRTIRATINAGRQAHGLQPVGLDTDPLDLERLTYDDPKVFELFARAETAGIFQFESGGMRNTLLGMKPDRLEDLIAANALFRPGPMELIPNYNNRKHGREPVPSVHPIVDRLTAETYGIMVYQEQVMQVVNQLGGIPLRQAYTLIKAISKKKKPIIDANRAQFIAGAAGHGVSEAQAQQLFELILNFAGYGFNKSHSTGYAIVAYQTGYLKTYFPLQYMAAVLTYESVSIDKVVEYIDECRRVRLPDGRRGIEVRPPDINESDIAFTVVFDDAEPRDANHGHVRFGLSAVKGVGEKAIRAILDERSKNGPFTSLYDFCERVPLGAVNRATIEALIKCGAFDGVHGMEQRAAMVEALDAAIQSGQRVAADRDSGQMNFFGVFTEAQAGPERATSAGSGSSASSGEPVTLPRVEPWPTREQLRFEKEVLGFYLTSHPLDQHADTIERFSTCTIDEAKQLRAGQEVVVGGMLSRVRPTFTRQKQEKMAMLTIEDRQASIDAVVFPRTYDLSASLLEVDRIVFLRGKVDRNREEPNLVVDKVIPLEQAAAMLTERVRIVIHDGTDASQGTKLNGEFTDLRELLRRAAQRGERATADVALELHQAGRVVTLKLNGLRVAVDDHLVHGVHAILRRAAAHGRCELIGPAKVRPRPDAAARLDAPAEHVPTIAMTSRVQDGELCASLDRY